MANAERATQSLIAMGGNNKKVRKKMKLRWAQFRGCETYGSASPMFYMNTVTGKYFSPRDSG